MKIGMTKTKDPNTNSSGKKFEYTIHYRLLNGKLENVSCTNGITVDEIVTHIAEKNAEASMENTDAETLKEYFLEEL